MLSGSKLHNSVLQAGGAHAKLAFSAFLRRQRDVIRRLKLITGTTAFGDFMPAVLRAFVGGGLEELSLELGAARNFAPLSSRTTRSILKVGAAGRAVGLNNRCGWAALGARVLRAACCWPAHAPLRFGGDPGLLCVARCWRRKCWRCRRCATCLWRWRTSRSTWISRGAKWVEQGEGGGYPPAACHLAALLTAAARQAWLAVTHTVPAPVTHTASAPPALAHLPSIPLYAARGPVFSDRPGEPGAGGGPGGRPDARPLLQPPAPHLAEPAPGQRGAVLRGSPAGWPLSAAAGGAVCPPAGLSPGTAGGAVAGAEGAGAAQRGGRRRRRGGRGVGGGGRRRLGRAAPAAAANRAYGGGRCAARAGCCAQSALAGAAPLAACVGMGQCRPGCLLLQLARRPGFNGRAGRADAHPPAAPLQAS